jgi:TP901 family phage tail tape measure protein
MFGEELAKLFIALGADITDFEKKMGRAVGVVNRTGKGFMDMGKMLTRAISIPILAISGLSLKFAIDFESAFAGVRKTVTATEAEFSELRKGILEMSTALPATASEIAAVAEAAGQLGIQTDAILSFSRVMIDLGETTDLAAQEAARALARVANIMGTNQKLFSNMGASIVALGNSMATTESEIVTMTLRLAAAGKEVGLTEAETLAFAAALSQVGIRAEAGGTAFSKVFIEISKAVALGSKTLAIFADVAGMSIDDFSKTFKEDAAEAVIKFVEGLGRVKDEGENVFVVLDKLGIQERRMANALLATANSGEKLRIAMDLSTEAWRENLALTEEAEKRYETTASQLKIVKNTAVKAAIAIGDTMKGALLSLVTPLKGMFESLENLAIKFSELDVTIRVTIGAFVALVFAVGPVLFSIGLMQKALPILALGFAGLTKAVVRFRAALTLLAAHPIVLALTIIAAEIAYLSGLFDGATEASTAFADAMDIVKKKSADAVAALNGFTKAQLEARAASLLLEIAEKKKVLAFTQQIAAARQARGETDNHTQIITELATQVQNLNIEYIAATAALKNLAEAEEEVKDNLDDIITPAEEIIEIYKKLAEATTELTVRKRVMGEEFNHTKEEVGLLEEAIIRLLIKGVDPLSEEFVTLAERLEFVRNQVKLFGMEQLDLKFQPTVDEGPPEKIEDPPWLVKLKEDEAAAQRFMDNISMILSSGTTDAAAALAAGIGQMAAGTAGMGDVFASVLSVLGDVAIRIGKVAIATGIGMIKIKEAFTNPASAIAAGVALVALGAWVKASISGAMSGGGTGGGFSGGVGGAGGFQNVPLGNYNPRVPREDRFSRSGRFPASDRDESTRRDSGDVGGKRRDVSIVIEPRAIASGDIEYSVRESSRQADNRGTEVI